MLYLWSSTFLEGFVLEIVEKNVLVFMNMNTNDVHTEYCFKKNMFKDFIWFYLYLFIVDFKV